jgi:hypothetical protein
MKFVKKRCTVQASIPYFPSDNIPFFLFSLPNLSINIPLAPGRAYTPLVNPGYGCWSDTHTDGVSPEGDRKPMGFGRGVAKGMGTYF